MTLTSGSNIKGFYYNSKSSKQNKASIEMLHDGTIIVTYGDNKLTYSFDDVKISNRIGNTPRVFSFKDNSTFETTDNQVVDETLASLNRQEKSHWLYILESKKKFIASALILFIAVIYLFFTSGVPFISYKAAFALPSEVVQYSGKEVMQVLDRTYFTSSMLSEQVKQKYRKHFKSIIQSIPEKNAYDFILLFRDGGPLGANALALPNGTVVVTDQLIEMAKKDEEIIAVMAHEVGHIVNRHGLRMALQNSVIALVVAMATGDVVSSSSIIVALPAVLIQSGYSRKFEYEADLYALNYLQKHSIDPSHFVAILQRLTKKSINSKVMNLISTHPSYKDRVKIFKKK